jgi:excisionase family DNA binding protein
MQHAQGFGKGTKMVEVLSVSEAARRLKVSAQTVRDWADRGKLPVMRTAGGQRIFQRDDIERARQERQAERIAEMRA